MQKLIINNYQLMYVILLNKETRESCTIISSRKAPRIIFFSHKTAVLEGKKIKSKELKSLNPSGIKDNNHYMHITTQIETNQPF